MAKELIDVLDENGMHTGEVLARDEIHKRGLWHRAIVVAIINENNEILLQLIVQFLINNILFK